MLTIHDKWMTAVHVPDKTTGRTRTNKKIYNFSENAREPANAYGSTKYVWATYNGTIRL